MRVTRRARVSARPLRPLAPTVFYHQIHDLYEMLTYLPHTDRLPARVGALEHHGEQVRGEGGILKSGRLAEADDALVRSKLVLFHDPPRRMVWIGQLGEGVAKSRAAFFHRAKLGRCTTAPILELALRISAVLGVEILPVFLFVRDDPAHPFRDQLILRSEVAVERHLVRLRRLGDRFDPDTSDTLFMKQVSCRHQNPRPNGDGRATTFSLFQSVIGNICFHNSLYPSLTKMLPIGNIGVLTVCYRSVTYYMSKRSATTTVRSSGPTQWSCAT